MNGIFQHICRAAVGVEGLPVLHDRSTSSHFERPLLSILHLSALAHDDDVPTDQGWHSVQCTVQARNPII
jgi:hypothetical protein